MPTEIPGASNNPDKKELITTTFKLKGRVAALGANTPPVLQGRVYTSEEFWFTEARIIKAIEEGSLNNNSTRLAKNIYLKRGNWSGGILAADGSMAIYHLILADKNRKLYSPFPVVLYPGGVTSHWSTLLREECPDSFVGLASVPVKRLQSGDQAEIRLLPGNEAADIFITRTATKEATLKNNNGFLSRLGKRLNV